MILYGSVGWQINSVNGEYMGDSTGINLTIGDTIYAVFAGGFNNNSTIVNNIQIITYNGSNVI